MNFVDTKKEIKTETYIPFCANSLSWYYAICMMPIFYANTQDLCHLNCFNNFVYTPVDHTFDHTVVGNYHMFSLHSQWDNDIIMGSTFKLLNINFVNVHREARSPCPMSLT